MSKSWDRPWSTDEIIENSESWSLAGDVALLHTLQAFADSLLSRTSDINNKLQNLTNSLDETSLQLDIAQNEFQGLRNTQFIESRVYEDDESLPMNEEKKVEEKTEDHCEDVRLAALKGLEVLDEYFEKVEVSVSDSEDDDIDLPNYVLRPRDLYIHRPLPYVIGSSEWHKTWHVGLEDSSSDSETEKVSDKFSESDSESELPIIQDRSQIKGTSDTSSEFDFSQKTEAKLNIPNSSDSENSVPAHAPISNPNFAEQLAAKLGHVITEYQEPEVNTRPIVKPTQTAHYGDMFFDEPPPLDEPKGIFSGGGGLFDEDDDVPSPKTGKSGGLFDDDSDDDKHVVPSKKTLVPQEPPQIDVRKPVGGVSILGGGNLFDKKLLRRQPSSEDEEEQEEKTTTGPKKVDLFGDDDLFTGVPALQKTYDQDRKKKVNLFDSEEEDNLFAEEKTKKTEKKEETPQKVSLFDDTTTKEDTKPKKVSLFDDDDDLFKDDLFSTNTKKSFTSGLFDDISGEDLFEEKSKPSGNIYDDLVAIPDKDSINVDPPRKSQESKPFFGESPKKNIFEESEPLFSTSPKENPSEEKAAPTPQPRLSLFDSPPPEPDDLFGWKNSPDEASDLFDKTPPKTDIPSSTPQDTPNLRLFDPSPPPDDEWDTKSDNISENDDVGNDFEEAGSKTSLFSEEPPALDFEPETTKPKPGKLKHNLNINVGALMPGYVPPKRTEKVPDAPTSYSSLPATMPDNIPSEIFITKHAVVTTSPTDSPASFDETDNVEVLHSVTKDRARVPLNRRPSTRRGRQAALKNSASDFKLQGNKEIQEKVEEPVEINKKEKPKEKSLEIPKSDNVFGAIITKNIPTEDGLFKTDSDTKKVPDKDDLFESEENAPDDLFSSEKTALFDSSGGNSDDLFAATVTKNLPKPTDNLFDSPEPISDNLFTESPTTDPFKNDLFETSEKPPVHDDLFAERVPQIDEKEPVLFAASEAKISPKDNLFMSPELSKNDGKKETKEAEKEQARSLFDDDDDDDDLFSAKKPPQSTKSKKSLFDDNEDDDDDIFKNFSSAGVKKTETKVAMEKKIPKVSSVKKLENTKPDDDPLSALLK